MNNIRAIEALNKRELEAGISTAASWHNDWADTAYVYIGGLPYELSEGDIITIFSQYGEPAHVNLIRDKETGKSKGFAFLKYEDQRSTNLAVDNLGGTTILGRIIRVDHTRYKQKEGEDGAGDGADEVVREEDEEKDEEKDGDRRPKRWRGSRERKEAPRRILKEERELQELIQNHDEDDPMKQYLIRQKEEEVQLVLANQKKKKKSSRHKSDDKGERKEHRHRSHRHRSRSREASRRHRSRSRDPKKRNEPSGEEKHGKNRDRDGRRDRHRDSEGRDKPKDREGDSEREKERNKD